MNKIKNWLKSNLTEGRYEHSLGTADCAKKLAKLFNLDIEKAYLAGLIHDCAKCLSKDEISKLLTQIELTEGEDCNYKTHHAPAGVIIAKKELGIDDEEILSAIRWHTIGKLNMTTFEKIIFLADKIENRTRPKEIYLPIEKELENNLDNAILLCYKNTIKSLINRNLKICKMTIDIYNSLL